MVLTDNLTAYWKFDEATGTNAVESIHGIAGWSATLSNSLIWDLGKLGSGIYCASAYTATVASFSNFNFFHALGTTGKWSVSLWYKLDNATATNGSRLFSNLKGADTNGIDVVIGASNSLLLVIGCYPSNPSYPIINGDQIATLPSDTNWHHLVITYDQSLASNNCVTYLDTSDTTQYASKTANIPSTGNAAAYFKIGKKGSGTGNFFNGTIDEFGIWNGRVIDSGERALLNNLGRGLPYPFKTPFPSFHDMR